MRSPKPRLGVSSCLLGRRVRWDGEHRRDPFVVDVLGPFVEWVPVCPEKELGMGVPREPIRLVGRVPRLRLVAERSGKDWTEEMRSFAARRVAELEALDLSGYVTKRDSPSCGTERVRVWPRAGGPPRRDGVGAFAAVLLERLPLLPVVEEGRLRDPRVRTAFVERIFALARWKAALAAGMTRVALARFHAAHELELLAHDPGAWRRLGRIVASPGKEPLARRVERYGLGFIAGLRVPATRARNAVVLRRALGVLRGGLDPAAWRDLDRLVRGYRHGRVPLDAPLALLRRHAERQGARWLAGQTYLDPRPAALGLRGSASALAPRGRA
jgi:uncharacterized protein YbbK (DUF523 family)/uncharacterized protein YbgA (DUF1722 family)